MKGDPKNIKQEAPLAFFSAVPYPRNFCVDVTLCLSPPPPSGEE